MTSPTARTGGGRVQTLTLALWALAGLGLLGGLGGFLAAAAPWFSIGGLVAMAVAAGLALVMGLRLVADGRSLQLIGAVFVTFSAAALSFTSLHYDYGLMLWVDRAVWVVAVALAAIFLVSGWKIGRFGLVSVILLVVMAVLGGINGKRVGLYQQSTAKTAQEVAANKQAVERGTEAIQERLQETMGPVVAEDSAEDRIDRAGLKKDEVEVLDDKLKAKREAEQNLHRLQQGASSSGVAAPPTASSSGAAAKTPSSSSSSSSSGAPPSGDDEEARYAYRKAGKAAREIGSSSSSGGDASAGVAAVADLVPKAEESGPGFDQGFLSQVTSEVEAKVDVSDADYVLIHHLNAGGLFFQRAVFYLVICALALIYLNQFNGTFPAYAPVPIAHRLIDGLFSEGKEHAVHLQTADVDVVRYFLQTCIDKGEGFVLFADQPLLPGGRLLRGGTVAPSARTTVRFLAGRLAELAPTSVRHVRSDGPDFFAHSGFLFETAWTGRCVSTVLGQEAAKRHLLDFVELMRLRRLPLANAGRTLNLVWALPSLPPASLIDEISFLCANENLRLVLVHPGELPDMVARHLDAVYPADFFAPA